MFIVSNQRGPGRTGKGFEAQRIQQNAQRGTAALLVQLSDQAGLYVLHLSGTQQWRGRIA